jgi:hypothetical protein
MDVVGNSTLKAEVISPIKLQGYRYAFGDPEWLGAQLYNIQTNIQDTNKPITRYKQAMYGPFSNAGGPHALQLHCIWDLGALDRARALCTRYKQATSK